MIPSSTFRHLANAAFSIWIVSAISTSAESSQKQLPGKVLVADVVGKVEAVGPESTSARSLKKKDTVTERHTVNVGDDSNTTLVFSNGSTISLLENSSLIISQFLQNPFSTPFAMPVETEEPTTSTTKLNLVNGEVVCKVKKLRIDEGSSLSINTPVGSAGVRGTTFAVSYLPNQNGTDRGTFVLSVTEGVVALTDEDGNVTLIPAGQQITVSFRSVTDPITGEITFTEILNQNIGNIPADRLDRINQVAASGDTSSEFTIFDATEVGPLDILQGLNMAPGLNNLDGLTEAALNNALNGNGNGDGNGSGTGTGGPPTVTDVNPQSNGL